MYKKKYVVYNKKPKDTSITSHSENYAHATYLVIVESPSKCAKIEHYLGADYCCIATKGHLRTIDGLKSIDTKGSFQPRFSIIDEKETHLKNMRKVILGNPPYTSARYQLPPCQTNGLVSR